MTAVFASCLLLSLALAAATAFASRRFRPRLKAGLFAALFVTWASLGLAVAQIVTRTSYTLVAPGGARRPELFGSAASEALVLLASMGGPALLATFVAYLALRTSRARPGAEGDTRTP